MYILPWNTKTTHYCEGIHWHSEFPFICRYSKDLYSIISGKFSLHKKLSLNSIFLQSLNAGLWEYLCIVFISNT